MNTKMRSFLIYGTNLALSTENIFKKESKVRNESEEG